MVDVEHAAGQALLKLRLRLMLLTRPLGHHDLVCTNTERVQSTVLGRRASAASDLALTRLLRHAPEFGSILLLELGQVVLFVALHESLQLIALNELLQVEILVQFQSCLICGSVVHHGAR